MNNLYSSSDFKAPVGKQTSFQMKMRLLNQAHFQDGQLRSKIAEYLKVSRTEIA